MFSAGGAPTFRGVLAASIGLLLLTTASSAAGEGADTLARAQELIQSFEYDAALEQLDNVAYDSNTAAPQRVEALELMGVLHFNLNQQQRARQLFERLLNVDPGHELTDTSYPPRLLRYYSTIRDSFIPQVSVEIEVDAFQDPPGSGHLQIETTVAGSTEGVAEAVALVRNPGEGSYRRAQMSRDGEDFFAEIPLQDAENAVEFYVEVTAPSGHVLAHAGSADDPISVSADSTSGMSYNTEQNGRDGGDRGDDGGGAQGERRWYATWWFWTIVGVVVAGSVATAIVLTLPDEQQEGSLGTRSLP